MRVPELEQALASASPLVFVRRRGPHETLEVSGPLRCHIETGRLVLEVAEGARPGASEVKSPRPAPRLRIEFCSQSFVVHDETVTIIGTPCGLPRDRWSDHGEGTARFLDDLDASEQELEFPLLELLAERTSDISAEDFREGTFVVVGDRVDFCFTIDTSEMPTLPPPSGLVRGTEGDGNTRPRTSAVPPPSSSRRVEGRYSFRDAGTECCSTPRRPSSEDAAISDGQLVVTAE